MGGCAAINCSNHSRKGFRMFRFPKDSERRKKWVNNCRRDNWKPGVGAQLCIVHFEESQFEELCEEKKLRKNAIPTLFSVPNVPSLLTVKRQKGFGSPKPGTLLETVKRKREDDEKPSTSDLVKRVKLLENKVKNLQEELKEKDKKLESFLSEEQIKSLGKDKTTYWSNEAIIKGLKMRFALGKHGYNYLKKTQYPGPSYSTINRRIQDIKLDFGVMQPIFNLLKSKIDALDDLDRRCCIMFDEMEIADVQDFDAVTKSFVGNITLGNPGVSNHLLIFMLRGLRLKWKQIVAHELTGPSTSGFAMKTALNSVIEAARAVGFVVKASTSDMGSSNKALWASTGVTVSRNERKTAYTIGTSSEKIHCIADPPHLLKNMKAAFLRHDLFLPQNICDDNDLPSRKISSVYIKTLWLVELEKTNALRSLHHLNKNHLFPSHFSTMNVAVAVQLFSFATAAALEKAVTFQQLEKEALTTAWFIRLIAEWYQLMSARHSKQGITQKNMHQKFLFLETFMDIMQHISLGKGWKPLQTGMILSTTSVIELSKELFAEGFRFFLPGRLTQDPLENVFSQVRRKSGTKPTALQAKQAVRLICISQFISDIETSNYASESDFHLFDTALLNTTSSTANQDVSVAQSSTSNPSASNEANCLSIIEENDVYYIAGSILKANLIRKDICQKCLHALKDAVDVEEPTVPGNRKVLTDYNNRGGLLEPKSGIFRICQEAERTFQNKKKSLLSLQTSIDDTFIRNVFDNCVAVTLPQCCGIKEKVITNYLIIRCKGLQKYFMNKKASKTSYASASANKKQ